MPPDGGRQKRPLLAAFQMLASGRVPVNLPFPWGAHLRIVYVGTFGMAPKSTMRSRALPLARTLAAQGHRVTLVLPPWDNPAESGRAYDEGGVPVLNLRLPPRLPLVGHLWLAARLARSVLALRPDVVHVFKPKGYSAAVAQALLALQALGRWRNLRVVVDSDDWEGEGGWNDVEPYPWWQRRLFAWQEQWLLRHAPAVTCASRALLAMAQALRAGRAAPVYVPNGAAPWPRPAAEAVAGLRRRLGISAERPVLLLYTRFVECSAARFVRLLRLVEVQGVAATVLLVGAGRRGEERAFQLEVQQAGLGLPVAYAGWVAPAELPVYLATADVALFPMEDTLINRTKCSVKLLDLLGAGVPVVAEAVGQCTEYIEDGASGVLTPPGDDVALAGAAAALLRDPARRARLAAGARARMEHHFGWEVVAAPLAAAYGLP